MKMREVKGIDVAANGKTELKPGGFHIMLVGLADGLKEGAKFPLKLKFEKAGEVTVQVTAEKPDAHGHGEHKH
jgi:copper(I)-binding protein